MIQSILKNVVLILALLFSSQLIAQSSDKFVRTDVVYLKNGSIFRGQIELYEHGKELRLRLDENQVIIFEAKNIKKIVQIANESETEEKELKYKKSYEFREKGLYFHSSLGYIGGNNLWGTYIDGFNVHAQAGYQFNRLIGAGLGTGVDYYNIGLGSIIPIYGTARGYLKKSNVSPYYQLAAGFGIPIENENSGFTESKGGYYLAPELGFRFGASNEANFTLGMGLTWQKATYTTTFGDTVTKNVDDYTFRRFNFKIGVLF